MGVYFLDKIITDYRMYTGPENMSLHERRRSA